MRFLPLPEEVAEPQEKPVLGQLLEPSTERKSYAQLLAIFDDALTKLQRPTELRGLVQFYRAGLLLNEQRQPQALDAIEESIRLLPSYSGPLINAAAIYAYANQPGKGTDYFLRAAQIDPESVRRVDDYEVNNLLRRLTYARDERRARALSDKLLEIGWVGNNLDSRSSLAATAIEQRLDDGDVKGAQMLVPKLLVPQHSYELLIDKKYAPIWPDLEAWGGPKLQNQWSTYLREAHDRWAASKDVETVRTYLGALRTAGHNRTIIRDILPLFYGKLDPIQDMDLQFVVTGVAAALANEGRWVEVNRVFQRAQEVWPLRRDNPNSLNVAANWASYLLFEGKPEEALAKMDVAIEFARQWDVNPDAIGLMHHYRACMLHVLGRDSEMGSSIRIATATGFPADVAGLHLCTGNRSAALRVLIEGLESETSRGSVLSFIQKDSSPPLPCDYSNELQVETDRLRTDPHLLAKVSEYGRLLPYGLSEGAPPESAF